MPLSWATKSVYHAEMLRKVSAAEALTFGALRGSGVELPVQPHGRPSAGAYQHVREGMAPTLVFADTAHTSRRLRDPASVEAAHKAALESNPRAFAMVSGLGSRYSATAATQRAVTPTQGVHLRLTAVEATLARLKLYEGGPGPSKRSTRGLGDGEGDGAAFPPAGQRDRSLQAALSWRPSTVPAANAATLASLEPTGRGGGATVVAVPEAPRLLQLQGGVDPLATFSSRASSRAGVRPGTSATGLSMALEATVASRAVAEGLAVARGGGGTMLPPPSPLGGRGGGRASSPSQSGQRTRPRSMPPVNDIADRRWLALHSRDATLPALPLGDQLIATAATQARHIARQSPSWSVDLTHGFMHDGEWARMNFGGATITGPEGCRPLEAVPLRRGAAEAPTSPGFLPDRDEGVAPPPHRTVLGELLSTRQPGASLGGSPTGRGTQGGSSRASGELAELDSFDHRHPGLADGPSAWPRRVIAAKISASGLAADVGFPDARSLELADRAALLNGLERLPQAAARRRLFDGT